MQTIPLQMASLSKYQAGTSILRQAKQKPALQLLPKVADLTEQLLLFRPNGFEVTSRDGKCKVSLQCGETEPGEWIDTITGFLRMHNNLEVSYIYKMHIFYIINEIDMQLEHYNNNTDRNDQVRGCTIDPALKFSHAIRL